MKTQSKAITITPSYQQAFVIGVLGGWALLTLLIAHQLASGYTSTGTWMFQVSTWLFPALIFAASLGFARTKYKLWLQRLFLGAILATIAMSVYSVAQWLDNYWYVTVYSRSHPIGPSASYWQTFGNPWILMLASLAVYIGVLLWIKKRKA